MNRLKELRNQLKSLNLDAFVIPTRDAHDSEFISAHDSRRSYITKFNGSWGTAVVTMKKAGLWVDPRYWIEAESSVDKYYWEIIRVGKKKIPSIPEWINQILSFDKRIGLDPYLISANLFKEWKKKIDGELVLVDSNPVDAIWKDQPKQSERSIFIHPMKYAGESKENKITSLKNSLNTKNCYATLLTELDEIAWLLNLRGNDIDFNPVFISYCLITKDNTILFINQKKLDKPVTNYLTPNVEIKDYRSILDYLKKLNTTKLDSNKNKILLNSKTCNQAIHQVLNEKYILNSLSLVSIKKALKNKVEIEGMRLCHIRDGAAKTAWMAWLEDIIPTNIKECFLTEYDVSMKLEEFRKKQDNFVSLSFDTICAIGENAAIIHYKPNKEKSKIINPNKMLLVDSGGQYKDGTTDVTRTFHLSTPTQKEIDCYTRVLKGQIALDTAIYPENISGVSLDSLARMFLWKVGLNYQHGTGHGVGSFLNVHEGPQSISTRSYEFIPLKEGMICSNEPGYYEEGKFGIRLENLFVIKKSEHLKYSSDKVFYENETLTMIPYQKKLIDYQQLTSLEKKWLRDYHEKCLDLLSPLLKDDKRAFRFLEKSCRLFLV